MAASVALANGGCSGPPPDTIVPYVEMPEAQAVGVPRYFASAVVRDGHAHGVLVGTVDGRPVKIEGNPLHPASLGATDVFAQASVLQLWDPDRSATVRQRLAPRPSSGAAAQVLSGWPAFEAAWLARASTLDRRAGEGLHLLTGPLTSPTARALLARCLQRWPRARWHVHAPLRPGEARAGTAAAFGRPLTVLPRLAETRSVLALATDPFSSGEWPGAVRQSLDWTSARARARHHGAWPRAFAVEVTPGLFGARADARLALPPHRIEALLWRLARRWFSALPPAPAADALTAAESDFESRVVQALGAAGPHALVLAGPGLSAPTHALVAALNQRLGAVGRGLALIDPPDAAPEAGDLATLVQALDAGAVDTLLAIDANPLYDAPGAFDLPRAWQRARLSVHAGLYTDETARACDWHLPLSHDLEQWADARAFDGTATVLQPAIAPLHDSRSTIGLLALLAGLDERQGRALVRAQWEKTLGPGTPAQGAQPTDFEAFWRDTLRQGFAAGSAAPAVQPPAARLPATPPAFTGPELVAWFEPDPAVHDGRYANLGWLQELPRPFSKLTWDNALLLGPRTAQRLGLATGDRVQACAGHRYVEAPVWVSPGQAEGVAALPLGYGRRHAGAVGDGVGFDAYALMPRSPAPTALALSALGRRHAFAATQHTFDDQGREPVRTLAPGERIADPGLDHPSLYTADPAPARPEHAWAMVIDLDACIGCNACTIACQAENNIPVVGKAQVALGREMHWIRVDRYEAPATGHSVFQPLPCMHCEKAPCELVCPVGATQHDSDGLNVQVYNRCVGTRFCSNNCPYKVRRFNFLAYSEGAAESLQAGRNPDVTVRSRGVMEKCTYCLQRIARARHRTERTGEPLADGDVVTACQAVCPTRAIHFGDLALPDSEVSRLRASPRHYALLGELNTRPRTTYLARLASPGAGPGHG